MERRYLGAPVDAGWPAYSGTGFGAPPAVAGRHDLPLAERITLFIPRLDGSGAHQSDLQDSQQRFAYHRYNGRGQVTGVARRLQEGTAGRWVVEQLAYEDRFGNLVRRIDPLGHVTELEYDGSGYPSARREKEVADADGGRTDLVTRFGYESASGWKSWEKNPRGYVTEYRYDALGRVTRVVEPADSDPPDWGPGSGDRTGNPFSTIAYGDEPDDLFAETSDCLGRRTRYRFDDLGQLVRISRFDREGEPAAVTSLTYNRWGQVTGLTDPNGNEPSTEPAARHTTWFTYDALGRRSGILYPDETDGPGDNPRRRMDFDYAANLLSTIDENGHRGEDEEDMAGRVIRTTRFDGEMRIEKRFYFDGLGNLVAEVGPRPGEVVLKRYDTLGRLVRQQTSEETFLEGGEEVRAAPVIEFLYDDAGRQTGEIAETAGGEKRIVREVLDGVGRPIVSRRLSAAPGGSGEQLLAEELRWYDGNGNLARVIDARQAARPAAERKAALYAWSARDKVLTEQDPAGAVTRYTYHPDGLPRSVTDPRGAGGRYPAAAFTVTYHYDELERLVRVELPPKAEGGGPAVVELAYDPRGNLVRRVDPDGRVTTRTWTPRHWLATETVADGGLALVTRHGYDPAGNRLTLEDARGEVTRFTYDALDRLARTVWPEGGGESCEYDAAGNRTARVDGRGQRTEWSYDLYNRLQETRLPGAGGPPGGPTTGRACSPLRSLRAAWPAPIPTIGWAGWKRSRMRPGWSPGRRTTRSATW